MAPPDSHDHSHDLGHILRYNAALLIGEGAGGLGGLVTGILGAEGIDALTTSNAAISFGAHVADYGGHAAGYAVALGILFRSRYREEGKFIWKRYVKHNLQLQLGHVGVDVLTYALRIGGSYAALKHQVHPALVMTGSAISGWPLHYGLMNIIGRRLGYIDHNHNHDHTYDRNPGSGTSS